MNTSRPNSMIIPPSVIDETNINGSKTKDSQSARSTNLPTTLPVNNIVNAHSSSSSLDSATTKNAIFIEKNSLGQIPSMTRISSTTTDSESESEHGEIFTDDNPFSESSNFSNQLSKINFSKCDNQQTKINDIYRQEQLSRRVKHFRKLFKSEFIDDMPELIDSYVCAYQGDILLQGKMYITDRYLCFHSRIISYVTKHVYTWEQIENVTKERVAFIFPTAIGIQLKSSGKRIIYASFLQRDQAYEKILLIWSRFGGHDSSSYQEDEDSQILANGTIKSNNNNCKNSNEKTKKKKRNIVLDVPDELEQDEVLQLCLRQDKCNTNKRINSSNSKNNGDKQTLKKFHDSQKKKSSTNTSNIDSIVSSHFNTANFNHSSSISNSNEQQKSTDITLINSSVHYRQSNHENSLELTRTYEQKSSFNPLNNNSSSNDLRNSEGLMKKFFHLITSTLTYLMKIFLDYLTRFFNQWKTYPIKTSIILLIFIIILIFHSFYLIQLAYRIEDRLHSLHHKWPSSTSMKNSLPTFDEF